VEPSQVRPHGYFVTGTDTGVGKTFVSVALARRARQRGIAPVFAYKPIETGCTRGLGDDQQALVDAAGGWQQGDLRGPYQFALPAAPNVAAAAECASIDLDRAMTVYASGSQVAALTIVEGAGGWRVPITADADMSGLARRVGLPVLVVARATLGTINHALLTVEAVERDGLAVGAVILSRRPDDDLEFAQSNAREIGRRWRGRLIVMSEEADLDSLLP
jgi:dethiobiotin synthetase